MEFVIRIRIIIISDAGRNRDDWVCFWLYNDWINLWWTARISWLGREHVITATAFIVPLGFFFPLQSTADFFGQWNNIFMWSAIALALASGNIRSVSTH